MNFLQGQSGILKLLRLILQKYSHLPIKYSFQNYLSVNVSLCEDPKQFEQFMKGNYHFLPQNKVRIFLGSKQKNGNRSSKNVLVFVQIHHSLNKYLPLSKFLVKKHSFDNDQDDSFFIEDCICGGYQTDSQGTGTNFFGVNENILNSSCFDKELASTEFIFWEEVESSKYWLELLKAKLEMTLSVHELFHSHLNLIFTLQTSNSVQRLESERRIFLQCRKFNWSSKQIGYSGTSQCRLELFEEDGENILIDQAEYCRIFMDSRASKITLEEVKLMLEQQRIGTLQKFVWGQKIQVNSGADGICFWVMCDKILLQKTLSLNSNLFCKHFSQAPRSLIQGGLLLLLKSVPTFPKVSYENLSLTTVIFNFTKRYASRYEYFLEELIPQQIKSFRKARMKNVSHEKYENNFEMTERLCDLLLINNEADRYKALRITYES